MPSPRFADRFDGDRDGFGVGGFDLVADRDQLELGRVVDAEVHDARRAPTRHGPRSRIECDDVGNDVHLVRLDGGRPFALASSLRLVALGRYADEFVRTDAGWKFRSRVFTPFTSPSLGGTVLAAPSRS